MDLAMLNLYITTLGKDKIFGFNYDNSRRVVRRVIPGPGPAEDRLETFDERFTIDQVLEAVVTMDTDTSGIPYKIYTPIDCIQGIYTAETPADIANLDKRYTLG